MPIAAAPILGAVIGGAGSVASGLIGAHAAGEASSDYGKEVDKGIQQVNSAVGNAKGLYNPYVNLGAEGLKSLDVSGLFGPTTYNTTGELGSNSLGEQFATKFQAPTAQQVADTPGYQFAKEAGLNAIQGSAAAQGNLLSGGTMKGLESYETGLSNQYYQQAYNNALNQYMNNYNIFNQNQANQYNRLMGATGVGLSAASASANTQMQGAGDVASMITGKGVAQGNADMAGANALSGGINGATNAFQLAMMNQNSQQGKTGSGYSPLTIPPTPNMNNLMPENA